MVEVITANEVCLYYAPTKPLGIISGFRKKPPIDDTLKDMTFSIYEGEVIGIVGQNGSGKSTLLRVIAGLMKPDLGSIDLHGRTVSLLALGVGFHSSLSGRDNIIHSGLLMGFSRKAILEKMDDIAAFSELGDAIRLPVSTYSSGMRSRLAFSIATELQTDILLMDEVLAVGDIAFRQKCAGRIKQLIADPDHRRTVVIVSHSLSSIRKLCGRTMWIDNGFIKMFDDTASVLAAYSEKQKKPYTDS